MHQRQYRNKVFATMQSSGWMALQSGQQRRRSEQGRVTFEVATRIEWFGKFEKLIHALRAMGSSRVTASSVKADIRREEHELR